MSQRTFWAVISVLVLITIIAIGAAFYLSNAGRSSETAELEELAETEEPAEPGNPLPTPTPGPCREGMVPMVSDGSDGLEPGTIYTDTIGATICIRSTVTGTIGGPSLEDLPYRVGPADGETFGPDAETDEVGIAAQPIKVTHKSAVVDIVCDVPDCPEPVAIAYYREGDRALGGLVGERWQEFPLLPDDRQVELVGLEADSLYLLRVELEDGSMVGGRPFRTESEPNFIERFWWVFLLLVVLLAAGGFFRARKATRPARRRQRRVAGPREGRIL